MPGDLAGGQAPGGVEPEAHGPAGHQRHAHGMAERVADERGQGTAPQGSGLPEMAQRQRVVERQEQVAERRPPAPPCRPGAGRSRPMASSMSVEGPRGQLAMDRPGGAEEQQQGQRGHDSERSR